MSGGAEMKICVVSPSRNTYSETFIRAHIDQPFDAVFAAPDSE